MKQILLSLAVLFVASIVNAQDVFKLGTTVKGKHVTYEVKHVVTINKRLGPSFPMWLVRNAHNVDTVWKEIPYRGMVKRGFFEDLGMQIGIILHDHLSVAEVAALKKKDESMGVVLRVDSTTRKVLQVTCFLFDNEYLAARNRAARGWQQKGDPVAYDGFWLNFDPDRLYVIEQDIVKRLVLPEDTPEMYLNDDFEVYVEASRILDPEKAKARKAAEEAEEKASREFWKKRNAEYWKGKTIDREVYDWFPCLP